MHNIFRKGDRRTVTACTVTSKAKGQGNKVMSSFWCLFANSTTKSRRNTKIGRKVVVPYLTFCVIKNNSKVVRSKIKVTRPVWWLFKSLAGAGAYFGGRPTGQRSKVTLQRLTFLFFINPCKRPQRKFHYVSTSIFHRGLQNVPNKNFIC